MGKPLHLSLRPLHLFVCAVVSGPLILFSLSCGSASSTVTTPSPSPAKCGVQAQPESSAFPAAGGSGTLRIETNRECSWSVASDAGWLALSGTREGQGGGSVPFTVSPNGDPASRSAALRIGDQQVQISQTGKPCEFALSSRRESIDAQGGNRTVEIRPSSAACEWTAASGESWISISSPRQGRGNGEVTFRVDAVETTSRGSRTGTVTIAGIAVLVEQTSVPSASCDVDAAPDTLAFGASGGSGDIRVTAPSDCPWTAESQSTWITVVAGASGKGAGSVNLRVAPTDGASRTGRVTVGNQVVAIEQSPGCTFAVDPVNYTAPAAGAAGAITVSTAEGCAWSAASGSSWMTISGRAGDTGPGRIEFTVAANAGPERAGTLTVAGRTIAVKQAAGCTYGVAPSSQDVGGDGGTIAVTLTTAAGCPWQSSTDVSWMTPSPTSGVGAARVQLAIAANANPPRSGAIAIGGQVLTVRQASQCTYTVLPPSSSYDAGGGMGSLLIIVSGPCSWTATTSAGWIRLEPSRSSGKGEGLVQFTIPPNSGAARSGTVVIAGQTHAVTQSGR
jgi:hypothetical protein